MPTSLISAVNYIPVAVIHYPLLAHYTNPSTAAAFEALTGSRQENDTIVEVHNLRAAALLQYQSRNVQACLDVKLHKKEKITA